MKWRMLAVLFVGASLATTAAGTGAGKTDQDKIQGSWSIVSMEKGGMKAPDEVIKDMKLTFGADKIKLQMPGKDHEVTYKLNASKKPKEIDIVEKESGKELLHKGIYVLEGDTLKICFGHSPDPRPTEFSTAGSASTGLIVLKRDKK